MEIVICERCLVNDKDSIVILSAEEVPALSNGEASYLKLTHLGSSLYNLMKLEDIEENILENVL